MDTRGRWARLKKGGTGSRKEVRSYKGAWSLVLGPWLTTWITFSSAECPRLVVVQACRTAGASSRPEWIAFSGATATYLKVQEDEEEAEEEEDNNDKKEEDKDQNKLLSVDQLQPVSALQLFKDYFSQTHWRKFLVETHCNWSVQCI